MNLTKQVTATKAARQLSELLDQVERYGEEFVVERHGRAVASIRPAGATGRAVTWAEIRDELVRRQPDRGFAAALRDLRRRQPKLPKAAKWERSSTPRS